MMQFSNLPYGYTTAAVMIAMASSVQPNFSFVKSFQYTSYINVKGMSDSELSAACMRTSEASLSEEWNNDSYDRWQNLTSIE